MDIFGGGHYSARHDYGNITNILQYMIHLHCEAHGQLNIECDNLTSPGQ